MNKILAKCKHYNCLAMNLNFERRSFEESLDNCINNNELYYVCRI
jgi:hypothetical protein